MLESLAQEYVEAVDEMRFGAIDDERLRWLEGHRGVLHQQMQELLERELGSDAMYTLATDICWQARLEGR